MIDSPARGRKFRSEGLDVGKIFDGTITFDEAGQAVKVVGVLSEDAAPATPQGLHTTEVTQTLVRLAWDDAAEAVSWDVYRDNVLKGNTAIPFYTDSTVAADTTYEYEIQAMGTSSSSARSPALEVTTQGQGLPAVPTELSLADTEQTSTFVDLVWEPAPDALAWDVHRDGGFLATTVVTNYRDNTVTAGLSYSYQVLARNSTGSSALCTALVVVVPANSLPLWDPSAANQTGVVGSAFSLNLATVCADPDQQVVAFSIIAGSVGGITLNGTALSGIFTTAGSPSLTIRASDGIGFTDQVMSFVITAVVDTTPPSVPGSVTATAVGSTVNTNWNPSTDASGIFDYQVLRNGVVVAPSVGGVAAVVPGPPWAHPSVPNGTYTYSVRARDNSPARNVSAAGAAPPVTVNVPPAAPDVPANFTLFAFSSSRIDSSWTAGTGGAPPTSYQLERSLTGANAQSAAPGTGGWTSSFSGLGLSDTDTGLNASTPYFYRLRALNGATASAYAVANITTPPSTGIVWPGPARQSGLLWYSGCGSIGPTAANRDNFQNLTGHPMDVYTEWTGKYNDTWTTVRQGGSGKFVNALDIFPDTTPIVHIWPLVPNSEKSNNNRWEELRDGLHDADLQAGFLAMKNRVLARGRALNTIIFDLSHEMSGTWYAWSLIDGAAKIQAFKDAWEHEVDILRDYFPTSLICFRPARRQGGNSRSITLNQMLPANTHFDLIGRSLHDENPHVNRADPFSWNRHVEMSLAAADQNIGLEHVALECRNRGKKALFAEWGTVIFDDGSGSHDPNVFGPVNGTSYWYEKTYEWFFANRDILLAETAFMTGDSRLWGTRSNTAEDPQLSARHEAGKATYNANSRWGAD